MSGYTRRAFILRSGGFLGASAFLAACASQSSPASPAPSASQATAAATPSSAAPTVDPNSTLGRIMSSKTIKVGLYNQPPWTIQNADGSVGGLEPELVLAALADQGVTKVDPVLTDFAALIPGLVASRFDLIAAGLFITPVRCAQIIFGDPDMTLGEALLVRKGNPLNLHSYKDVADSPKARIGYQGGSSEAKYVEEAFKVPADRRVVFTGPAAAYDGLVAGRVDAITFTAPTISNFVRTNPGADIERALPFGQPTDASGKPQLGYSGVGFRQSDTALRDVYNKGLHKVIDNGTWQKLLEKYQLPTETPPKGITAAQLCSG